MNHDSTHFINHVGPGWASLVKPIVSFVDDCHNLPFNGGRDFRWGTEAIVKFLWNHGSLTPFRKLRWKFLQWAVNSKSPAYWGHEKGVAPKIMQVKEKFGGLRVYVNGTNDFLDGMIHLAEAASYHICEECGKPGKLLSIRGWSLTLCEECHAKKSTNQ